MTTTKRTRRPSHGQAPTLVALADLGGSGDREQIARPLDEWAAQAAQDDAWWARHGSPITLMPAAVTRRLIAVDHVEALVENVRREMGGYWAHVAASALAEEELETVTCPDECPRCGVSLAADGYPIGHQDADTGEVCSFRWATGAIV